MKLSDLEVITTYSLASGQSLFRVQRARGSAVRRGPLKLAPVGLLSGRFDLPSVPCAYFGEAPDTALYEALFRREAPLLSLHELRRRELLTVQVRRNLELGDLRPHAANWPVLQSLRFGETQELASDAHAAGLEGLIYRSAQQHGQDCVVLFDPGDKVVAAHTRTALVGAGDTLNRWVMLAAQRSKVPQVP
ncbi:RES family NAD+ phosphorylase [Ramlibacter alkalitolerans]|uniref:RES family NAD+ phosphorylase n=1 Tax=Ramlibacter alkalitolerans TaxID=2039631 RepID=A0ABS1JL43_9BURK|nr:RES family NAD+ phosphorylase [Ramlibacter alkalitolerans]MBL0424901.1 RES family NAD+ phosphorylase [Ramlibacter alkalitolerans]